MLNRTRSDGLSGGLFAVPFHVHHMRKHIVQVGVQISDVRLEFGQMGTTIDLALIQVLFQMLYVYVDVFEIGSNRLQIVTK